jgi:hypothetical protein
VDSELDCQLDCNHLSLPPYRAYELRPSYAAHESCCLLRRWALPLSGCDRIRQAAHAQPPAAPHDSPLLIISPPYSTHSCLRCYSTIDSNVITGLQRVSHSGRAPSPTISSHRRLATSAPPPTAAQLPINRYSSAGCPGLLNSSAGLSWSFLVRHPNPSTPSQVAFVQSHGGVPLSSMRVLVFLQSIMSCPCRTSYRGNRPRPRGFPPRR